MKKRFLLIDSENVQNRLFEIIDSARKRDKVIVFYTVYHSGKLEEYLRSNKNRKNVEFVECIAGNNALDLQLMGVLAFLIHRHPKREFVVYSNDKGYKALVKHWQSKNVDVELVNFLTPAVGEDAYEFKAPITVETRTGGKKGKRSRMSFSSAGKSLSGKKEDSGTAVVEKTSIRREPSKPSVPEKPAQPAKTAAKKETSRKAERQEKQPAAPKAPQPRKAAEVRPAQNVKPAGSEPAQAAKTVTEPESAKPKPRMVVDALLIPSQTDSKPAPKAKVDNVVTAPEPKEEKAPEEKAVSQPAAETAETPTPETAEVQAAPEAAPVKKKRGRKSKAEKAAEEAAKAALAAMQEAEQSAQEPVAEEKPKTRRRRKTAAEKAEAAEQEIKPETDTETPAEPVQETAPAPQTEETTSDSAETESLPAMTEEEFVTEMCRSVRSTDLALINRVLTVGFGSEAAKGFYARFKTDPDYREEMAKLYNYSKSERVLLLMRTALRKGGIAPGMAEDICRILNEKGTANMQALYHSFIKEMPGNVSERQSAYKAVKPYLPITDSL